MLIAVTGANGFVGEYLVKHLLELGHEVRLIQRKTGPNVFYIEDIYSFDNWSKVLEDVDVVIHCAAKVHCFENSSKNNYEEFEKINVFGTRKIAIHAAKSKVKRFIFLSSLKVHGENTKEGFPLNNSSSFDPKDSYSLSKLNAEKALKLIAKEEEIEIVIIRSPLVYGPKVSANFLKLLEIVYRGLPLPFLDIRNTRSIIYVENLVSFIAACLTKESAINKEFLVSDLKPISTPNLIKLVARFLKKESNLFKVPISLIYFIGFITRKNNKLEKILNSLEIDPYETFKVMEWEPPYSTEYGIKQTVSWFKRIKNKF